MADIPFIVPELYPNSESGATLLLAVAGDSKCESESESFSVEIVDS